MVVHTQASINQLADQMTIDIVVERFMVIINYSKNNMSTI